MLLFTLNYYTYPPSSKINSYNVNFAIKLHIMSLTAKQKFHCESGLTFEHFASKELIRVSMIVQSITPDSSLSH